MLCVLTITLLFLVVNPATGCGPVPPIPSRTTERPITVSGIPTEGSSTSQGTGGTTFSSTASTEAPTTETTESISTPQSGPRLLVAYQAGRQYRTSTTSTTGAPTTGGF